MNPNVAQSLSWDHIREARQQATAARRAGAARHSVHITGSRAAGAARTS
jgi:hypothetical protein